MISATEAPSAHTWVENRPMETAVDAVETAVETATVEVVGEAAGAAMTPGTGVLEVAVDIIDC